MRQNRRFKEEKMETQGIKRPASDEQGSANEAKIVVVDIEGTTTPITFVKDTLFPYVRDNVKEYLTSNWEKEETQKDVAALREQYTQDKEANVEGAVEIVSEGEVEAQVDSLVANVLWQMDNDRKSTCLKQLQGHMWREAYESGKVKGSVYDDVVPALKNWQADGKQVYVYSSGSVEAQKLLFTYSNKGDLTNLFTGNFDTEIGAKVEQGSYSKIAEQTGVDPASILFLTDLPKEAAAASEAGLKTAVVVREGNEPLTDEEKGKFNTISSFSEICPAEIESEEPPAKKAAPAEEEASKEEENGDDDDEALAEEDDEDDVEGEDDDVEEGDAEEGEADEAPAAAE